MIFEKVYADFIQARKDKNEMNKNVLSLVYNSFKNKTIELRTDTLSDTECYALIRKMSKQLEEEIEAFKKANRTEKVNELTYQKELIEKYLPKQLSEDKIKEIISSLEDKAIPSVMKYFKTNYAGQVDMGLVSKIAKSL